MAYQQNNNNYRSNNRYSKPVENRPRNKTMTFSLSIKGINAKGRTYNVQSAEELIYDLNKADAFSKLSVPVQISRALVENDNELRGTSTAGFIKGFNFDNKDVTIDVVIYANFIEKIEAIDNLVVEPRFMSDRNENATTILGFSLTK